MKVPRTTLSEIVVRAIDAVTLSPANDGYTVHGVMPRDGQEVVMKFHTTRAATYSLGYARSRYIAESLGHLAWSSPPPSSDVDHPDTYMKLYGRFVQ